MEKKGQLGMIELQYFFYGLLAGLVVGIVLIVLLRQGVISFTLPYISC